MNYWGGNSPSCHPNLACLPWWKQIEDLHTHMTCFPCACMAWVLGRLLLLTIFVTWKVLIQFSLHTITLLLFNLNPAFQPLGPQSVLQNQVRLRWGIHAPGLGIAPSRHFWNKGGHVFWKSTKNKLNLLVCDLHQEACTRLCSLVNYRFLGYLVGEKSFIFTFQCFPKGRKQYSIFIPRVHFYTM